MHICDKCKHYTKCYSIKDDITRSPEREAKRAEVELGGCPDFKELTIEEMFHLKKGVLGK